MVGCLRGFFLWGFGLVGFGGIGCGGGCKWVLVEVCVETCANTGGSKLVNRSNLITNGGTSLI